MEDGMRGFVHNYLCPECDAVMDSDEHEDWCPVNDNEESEG